MNATNKFTVWGFCGFRVDVTAEVRTIEAANVLVAELFNADNLVRLQIEQRGGEIVAEYERRGDTWVAVESEALAAA